MLRYYKYSLFVFFLLPNSISPAHAEDVLRLSRGSYVNRSHVDTLLGRANLNFQYKGCDPSPSRDKIQLKAGECKQAKTFRFANKTNKSPQSGTVGVIVASYDEPAGACKNPVTRTLHVNRSISDLYREFRSRNCGADHLVIRDGTPNKHRQVHQAFNERQACALPKTVLKKPDFPSKEYNFIKVKANDKGFTVSGAGGHTHFRYDHSAKHWCKKYENPNEGIDKKEQCGTWPSPVPITYRDDDSGRFDVPMAVSLNPDGNASIRSVSSNPKGFGSLKELEAAQARGDFTKTNHKAGRYDIRTWRHKNGLPRLAVESYKQDQPQEIHDRTVIFYPRNVFGDSSSLHWCKAEHCLYHPPKVASLTKLACKEGSGERCYNSCSEKEPTVPMTNRGNHACFSCLGITPGLCAVPDRNNKRIKTIQGYLDGGKDFSIHPITGEPRLTENTPQNMAAVYKQLVERPPHPGCLPGSIPRHREHYDDPGFDVQASRKALPKQKERKVSSEKKK